MERSNAVNRSCFQNEIYHRASTQNITLKNVMNSPAFAEQPVNIIDNYDHHRKDSRLCAIDA